MILNFYNHFRNGDIFLGKEFILDIMKKLNIDHANFYHKNTHFLLKDINDLITQSDSKLSILDCQDSIFYYDNNMYINTWIGAKKLKYYCGIGFKEPLRCSLYSYYEMFKEIYNRLEIHLNEISYYVPSINFEKIDKINVDNFINKYKNKKILICNGDALSGQSKNISFDNIIINLSNTYKYLSFILTKKTDIISDNVFFTDDITKLERDLVEISYLSTYCDIIIGRSSGPHSYTYIKDNFFNKNKTNISICQYEYDGRWFYETDHNNIWTDNYDEIHLLNLIKKQIEK